MTTLRPFDSTSHRPLSREIKRLWKSGEQTFKPGETLGPSETVIEFVIRHSKERKVFYATITPMEYHDGMVSWVSDNPGITIMQEPVKRYSEKALADFSARAYERLMEVADDPRVSHYLDQIPNIKQEA